MRFYTNPVDILNVVMECLTGIMKAVGATGLCHESMLPFEVTFGLFFSCWAAADVPELKYYCMFVDDYLPEVVHNRLNSAFQFAHTKLQATVAILPHFIV
jgi:hypothetical protein